MKIKTVGVIGFGAMGQLLAKFASAYLPNEAIKIVETKKLEISQSYQLIPISGIKDCDLILLAISTKNLKKVAEELEQLNLSGNQIVCSIAATMHYAEQILKRHITTAQVILTHPLFGPASLKQNNDTLKNLEIALCLNYCRSSTKLDLRTQLSNIGLILHEMTPDVHDQIMAKNHLIPFLLSHILKDYEFIPTDFQTKSFSQLKNFLAHTSYSPEILEEIITYNPYAREALANFQSLFEKYSALSQLPMADTIS